MELDTRAIGVRIYNMDLEKRSGQTEVDTKATISKVRNMERGHILGQMAQFTMEIGMKTGSRATVLTLGSTVANS